MTKILTRDNLCQKYYHLVEYYAKKYFRNKYDIFGPGLVSAGNEAFIYVLDNLENFQINTEVKFEKYIKKMLKLRMISFINREFLITDKEDCIEFVDELSIKDNTEEEILANVDNKIMKNKIHQMLKKVTKNQKKILELYFGLNNNKDHSTYEVAKILGKKKSTIHKTKMRALETLREENQ